MNAQSRRRTLSVVVRTRGENKYDKKWREGREGVLLLRRKVYEID